MSVFAEIREIAAPKGNDDSEYISEIEANYETKDVKIASEVISDRSSDTKNFRMSDGSFSLVQYAEDVHYKNDN